MIVYEPGLRLTLENCKISALSMHVLLSELFPLLIRILISNSIDINGFNIKKKKQYLAIESDKVIYYSFLGDSTTLFLYTEFISHFDLKMLTKQS